MDSGKTSNFRSMDVSVSVLGLTGIMMESKERRKGFSKKLKKGASSETNSFDDDDVPVKAVVTFFKSLNSETSIASHLPSLPLRPIPTEDNTFIASWPTDFDPMGNELSTFSFSRMMRIDEDTHRYMTASRPMLVPERVQLTIALTRGSEMITVGTTTLVVTGDEVQDVQINLPLRLIEFDGATSKSKKKTAKAIKPTAFSSGHQKKYNLQESSCLKVLVRATPTMTDTSNRPADESVPDMTAVSSQSMSSASVEDTHPYSSSMEDIHSCIAKPNGNVESMSMHSQSNSQLRSFSRSNSELYSKTHTHLISQSNPHLRSHSQSHSQSRSQLQSNPQLYSHSLSHSQLQSESVYSHSELQSDQLHSHSNLHLRPCLPPHSQPSHFNNNECSYDYSNQQQIHEYDQRNQRVAGAGGIEETDEETVDYTVDETVYTCDDNNEDDSTYDTDGDTSRDTCSTSSETDVRNGGPSFDFSKILSRCGGSMCIYNSVPSDASKLADILSSKMLKSSNYLTSLASKTKIKAAAMCNSSNVDDDFDERFHFKEYRSKIVSKSSRGRKQNRSPYSDDVSVATEKVQNLGMRGYVMDMDENDYDEYLFQAKRKIENYANRTGVDPSYMI